MIKFVRKNIMWCVGLMAVAALLSGAAVAQIIPGSDDSGMTPGLARPPLITPIRPPLISPIRVP